jgi:two-component system OmpR family response regulator
MCAKRLLVVDDQPAIAELVQRFAEELLYEARTTYSGTAFKESYQDFDPDVVVLDLVMPDLDGFDLIEYLAQQHCRAHLVVITGHDPIFLKAACVLATARGMKSCTGLQKPFDLDLLRSTLRGFL